MKHIEVPGFIMPGIEDITRRDFLVGGAAALLLGGCGGSGGNEASGETKTVEHAMGTTEVPVNPQRIVTLGTLSVFDPLVQLGITPVGTVDGINVLSDVEGLEFVGDSEEPNLEAIAALEPDLIVGDTFNPEEAYERLSQIAPTVYAPDALADEDALDRQRFLADLVGRLKRFDELVAEYETRVEDMRRRLEPIRDSLEVSPLNPYAESDVISAFRGEHLGGIRVLSDLGISLSSGVRELPDNSLPYPPTVSFELLPELDGDVIFALFDPSSEESENEAFRSSPLLEQTFAARKDQVFYTSSDPWFSGSLLALNLVLDDIEKYLLNRNIDTGGDFR